MESEVKAERIPFAGLPPGNADFSGNAETRSRPWMAQSAARTWTWSQTCAFGRKARMAPNPTATSLGRWPMSPCHAAPVIGVDGAGYVHVSGGSIARYDHETGTWTPLGVRRGRWHFVIDHERPRNRRRCFMGICLDSENALQLAWKVNALGPMPNLADGSRVMYTALRDGETTWHKADSTPIADLPLTIENASVVAEDLQDPELAVYGIGVTLEGQPVINFRYTRGHTPEGKDKGWVVKWTGEGWVRVALPRAVVIPTLLMSHREGALFTHGPGGNTVYLSEDAGESWQTLTIPYERGYADYHSFDYRCFAETGEARLAAFFADKGAIEVWTVRRATE